MMEKVLREEEKVSQKETDTFPCGSCGGNMTFDPESNALSCSYCGNRMVIESNEDEIREYDFNNVQEEQESNWGQETSVIKCENCGAETVLDTFSTAEFCAFCGSSHVAKNNKSAGIAPESIIPFKISDKKAVEYFSNWIKKKFFVPKALKNSCSTQRLKGVYVPFWTYDSNTLSTYKGEGGTHYYVTESYTTQENGKTVTKTRQVRHTRWWPTSGIYSKFFDDILVNASKQVDKKIISKIEPFNLKELEGYKSEYLSGFYAERYSIDLKKGWNIAKDEINSGIRQGVIRKINADEVRNLRINTDYNDIKYKHLLLPIWLSAYTYKNKIYKFMINGQTGKVSGQSPISPIKVLLLVGAGIAIILIIYVIFGKNN